MTPEQTQSMELALDSFKEKARDKYRSGQSEHGGNLWERSGLLGDIKEEIVDQMFYLDALSKKVEIIAKAIEGVRVHVDDSIVSDNDLPAFRRRISDDLRNIHYMLANL